MAVKIKNCGLKTIASVDCAIESGASFVGFVHHAASPRHVDLEQLTALIEYAKNKIKTVAVLSAPTEGELWEIANLARPDYLQLHQIPSVSYVQKVQAATGIPIISAISVTQQLHVNDIATLEAVSDYLLFDAPYAGSGHIFDWTILKTFSLQKPWFLAGGLTVNNVAEAIRTTGAPMVDVSSGIESSRGVKSEEMIAAFNKKVVSCQS